MLLDRTHRQWAIISTGLLAAATVSYVIYASASHKGPTGGSWMGLAYGIIGSMMMIFSAMLAGRKQVPHWRIGSAQFWLRGHLWLGGLSLPFILFHSGFGLGGLLEQLLWLFFGLVIMSGVFGLLMQTFLPRLITQQIPRETFVAQLPFIRRRVRLICDKLVSEDCGRIKLVNEELAPQVQALVEHATEVAQLGVEATAMKETDSKKSKEISARAKEIKENWATRLTPENRTLFIDLSLFAKAQKWITREDDFTAMVAKVYDFPNLTPPEAEKPAEVVVVAAPDKPKAVSPLEAMKAKKADAEGASAEKKLSPLEQMKLKAALKKAAESPDGAAPPVAEAPKKLSPLEQMKAQAAAKKAALAPASEADKPVVKQVEKSESPASSSGKLPPITATVANVDAAVKDVEKHFAEKYGYSAEAAKEVADATRPYLKGEGDSAAVPAPAAAVPTPDAPATEPPKKLSPLEQMKAQAAAKKAAAEAAASAETPPPDAAAEPPKKLSPLEQMKAQAAAKKAAAEAAASTETPPPDAAAEPPKKLSPLEQMKAQAAAKKAAAEAAASGDAPPSDAAAEPPKKLSPLEQMKAQAAAKKAAAEAAASAETPPPDAAAAEPPKKLSPLEQMKAQAAAKKAAASGAEASPATGDAPAADPPKKLSPLEMMKQQAAQKAAVAGGAAPAAAAAADDKPKSPLELMKAKTAAAPPPAAKAPAKSSEPAPAIIKRTVGAKTELLRTEVLARFYSDVLRPYLNSLGRQGLLADENSSNREFTQMREALPVELHDSLLVLQERCDEHRQYARLERMHHWLHYWLALHIPFSIALFVFFFAHVIFALRVVPWSPFR